MVYYFDRTQVNGAVAIFAGEDNQVVYTGTEIHREPEKYREMAQKIALEKDIHFWVGKEGPAEPFYTVPEMELVAYDSQGGCFARCSEAWIYIDAEKSCYRLPEDAQLLSLPENWREHLEPLDNVHIFSSRIEAEREFDIQDFPQNLG